MYKGEGSDYGAVFCGGDEEGAVKHLFRWEPGRVGRVVSAQVLKGEVYWLIVRVRVTGLPLGLAKVIWKVLSVINCFHVELLY